MYQKYFKKCQTTEINTILDNIIKDLESKGLEIRK